MDFEKIGKLIKEERKKRNLTQEELAIKAGVTRQTISKMERGKVPLVTLFSFFKVLDALGLEMEVKPKKKRDPKRLWTPEELLE
ncbi:MAG: helix-turn-helix transcriptional regulator [Thermodesulfobacteria bacterium]|nr:helix-turn-helix transcriptional regulator [Thermodesulfobacteriota bacterium]